MRPSRFTEAQIVQALQQVSAGTPAVQICRELGITETTFYRWRKNRERVGVAKARDLCEMRELRDENHTLKQIVANMLLDKQRRVDARGRR